MSYYRSTGTAEAHRGSSDSRSLFEVLTSEIALFLHVSSEWMSRTCGSPTNEGRFPTMRTLAQGLIILGSWIRLTFYTAWIVVLVVSINGWASNVGPNFLQSLL